MSVSLWSSAAVFVFVLQMILPSSEACAIMGKVYCNRCWEAGEDSKFHEPISWTKVTVNCSVKSNTKSSFIVVTGKSDGGGSFKIFLDDKSKFTFLNTLYAFGNPIRGLLQGGGVTSCTVTTDSKDCDMQTFNDGRCSEGGKRGNGRSNDIDLVNIGFESSDIRINGEICNSPSKRPDICSNPSPPPPKKSPPPQPSRKSPPPPPPPVSSPPTPPTLSSPPPPVSSPPPPPTLSSPPPPVSSPPPPVSSPPSPTTNPSPPPPHTSSPPPPAGATGDPHFTGSDGSRFDFSGEPNKTFCLISDAHIHVNAYYGGRYERSGNDMHKSLTWIRKISILWGHHTIVVGAREGAKWEYDNGYLASVEVDGEPVKLRQVGDFVSRVDGKLEIRWVGAKVRSADDLIDVYQVTIADILKLRLMIRPEIALLRTATDGLVHIDFELPLLDVSNSVHGILGQTYRADHKTRLSTQKLEWSDLLKANVVPGDNAEGFLDGSMSDYVSSGLLQTNCRYSRFAREYRRDEETSQAIEITKTQVINTNNIINSKVTTSRRLLTYA